MTIGLNRREWMLAGAAAVVAGPPARAAGARRRLALELAPRDVVLKAGQPPVSAWRFAPDTVPRFMQGDAVDMTVANRLPAPSHVFFRGLDGAAALEPILSRQPIPPGGSADFPLNLLHAGTLICDARLGGGEKPLPLLPIVVAERVPIAVDRDEVMLIEDWRSQAGVAPVWTVNGDASWSLAAAAGDRIRLRLINGAQRAVFALQLSGLDVRVIAIDGQPSEPFPARDGRLVLAPGTRVDALVDMPAGGPFALTLHDGERTVEIGQITVVGAAARAQPLPDIKPLPSNNLPENLQLQSALRVDVLLDPSLVGDFTANQPAFYRVKRGRTVVLALQNTVDSAVIFQLHGHHLRLLDRLDDGWKPFWLDTVAVQAKQTVRVAYSATNPGAYLMEFATTAWGSAKKLRHYVVEP